IRVVAVPGSIATGCANSFPNSGVDMSKPLRAGKKNVSDDARRVPAHPRLSGKLCRHFRQFS
ncbi:hypothetical protein, partial [Burkholderia ubonensis]|uniref:hypothetical protein n=1 Tax=Burkholderia ubonensis TaxID=101571 RepID=UPI001C8A48B9